jgi:predicted RecB family nuclease
MISAIEKKTDETGQQMSADLKKERAELKEIKARLERIEGCMVPVQAELQSLAKPEDIKGIGPSLGKELRGLGINSVGDFLTADPAVIGEKTRLSQEMAENLQSMGQLMMVPGVDANDAEMLLEAGIKSRKELADHDLITLCKKVGTIAKVSVDQGKITKEESPSIEEISSWIRNA